MSEKRVLQLHPETFLLLVKQLRRHQNDADAFEVDLDKMKVKGDLKVIRLNFPGKEFIAKSTSLDLLKRALAAGWGTLRMPQNLPTDPEFTSLLKNKGAQVEFILVDLSSSNL